MTAARDAAAAARTACAMNAALVVALLESGKFDLSNEKATQADIEALLLTQIPVDEVRRECRLGPGDVPDFVLGGAIVLEVKGPRHQARAVLRQLKRYAAYPQVAVILLATSRAMHMPSSIEGKACLVLNLGRAWL